MAEEDGARREIFKLYTHAPPKDVMSGYARHSWSVLCEEMCKLRFSVDLAEVIPLPNMAVAVSTNNGDGEFHCNSIAADGGLEKGQQNWSRWPDLNWRPMVYENIGAVSEPSS